MLSLRRGTVIEAGDPAAPMQRLAVSVAGARRPALADVALVGAAEVGDEVVVNVAAVDLALGSGGYDFVHVNLTRGLDDAAAASIHVMKLNYTSLQHAVAPVESGALPAPLGRPVAVMPLHGHLAPLAFAFAVAAPGGARLGYVQSAGGALPGALSRDVRELRERGLLDLHVTAAPAYGGEREAITVAGALAHGLGELDWGAAVVGPGPGIVGSGSALGHGAICALDSTHAALALGCPALLVARMSDGDARPRHRGLSHHSRTVLALLLAPVTVALPAQAVAVEDGRHVWPRVAVDLEGYRASGLPATTMGRSLEEDAIFFAAALAAGTVLGQAVSGERALLAPPERAREQRSGVGDALPRTDVQDTAPRSGVLD